MTANTTSARLGVLRAVGAWLDRSVASLYPGSFALVMATGIISNAMRLVGRGDLSDALFAVNVVALPWLTALTCARLIRHRRRLWADLVNPDEVFGFFTIVAALNVFALGLDPRGLALAATVLWAIALAIWFGLFYFSFGVLVALDTERGAGVVHGGWLNAIVGTQSVVIAGALIAPMTGNLSGFVFVLVHTLWGVGIGLYGIFVTLFAYRIFFFKVTPDDITPLHWVVMGAAAISVNAGSTLLLCDTHMPFLQATRPFIGGVSLIMWAWGASWIPFLLLFGAWKYGVLRRPLTYTPMLWSLVFPLGMYALATLRLSLASDFPVLRGMAGALVWIALAAWLLTLLGLALTAWRDFRSTPSARPE